jgi:hypothetical protein
MASHTRRILYVDISGSPTPPRFLLAVLEALTNPISVVLNMQQCPSPVMGYSIFRGFVLSPDCSYDRADVHRNSLGYSGLSQAEGIMRLLAGFPVSSRWLISRSLFHLYAVSHDLCFSRLTPLLLYMKTITISTWTAALIQIDKKGGANFTHPTFPLSRYKYI